MNASSRFWSGGCRCALDTGEASAMKDPAPRFAPLRIAPSARAAGIPPVRATPRAAACQGASRAALQFVCARRPCPHREAACRLFFHSGRRAGRATGTAWPSSRPAPRALQGERSIARRGLLGSVCHRRAGTRGPRAAAVHPCADTSVSHRTMAGKTWRNPDCRKVSSRSSDFPRWKSRSAT
jgi:hypothetical protein